MKKTMFILLLFLSCCRLAAQCPTGNVAFSTQGQIDSFPINYPNCSEIEGNIFISGSEMVWVKDWPAGLYTLRAVSGGRAYTGRFVKDR